MKTTINALRDSIQQETLSSDENQDLSAISKAEALLRSVKEKEKTLQCLEVAQDNIDKDLKTF